MASSKQKLKVVTLNVWGLWLVSKKREQRIKYLAEWLKTCDADVVLLQEVWVDSDAQLLLASGKVAGLAHGVHFRSGMFGSGLVTMARYPITQLAFWAYAAAGISHAVHQGDFFSGKGVGWVRLQAPFGEVDVLNTHLHANYSHEYEAPPQGHTIDPMYDSELKAPADDAACYRVAQMVDLAQLAALVGGTSLGATPSPAAPTRPLILAGDLNCKPNTLELQLLRLLAPRLRDAWDSAPAGKRIGGVDGSNEEGLTCHAPGNSFLHKRQVPERIDYVWSDWECSRAEVVLTERTPGGTSYSDHYGVKVALEQPAGAGKAAKDAPPAAAAAPAKSLFGLAKAAVTAAPAAAAAAVPAAAGAAAPAGTLSAAKAAGLSDATERTALVGATTLLEQGMMCCGSDVALKSAAGAFLCALVVYCAFGLPYFVPWWSFEGLWLSAVLLMTGLMGAVGAMVFVSARVGDKGQLRALVNAHRQLKVFMEGQGMQVVSAGALWPAEAGGSGGSGSGSAAARRAIKAE